jgi:hypothetical protein
VVCYNDIMHVHQKVRELWYNKSSNTLGPQMDRILQKSLSMFPRLTSTDTSEVVLFYHLLQELSMNHLLVLIPFDAIMLQYRFEGLCPPGLGLTRYGAMSKALMELLPRLIPGSASSPINAALAPAWYESKGENKMVLFSSKFWVSRTVRTLTIAILGTIATKTRRHHFSIPGLPFIPNHVSLAFSFDCCMDCSFVCNFLVLKMQNLESSRTKITTAESNNSYDYLWRVLELTVPGFDPANSILVPVWSGVDDIFSFAQEFLLYFCLQEKLNFHFDDRR